MGLIVQKYGGTSVGSAEFIRNVAGRIIETQRKGNKVVAVVSAMAGVTDQLLKLARDVSGDKRPTEREIDVLLATGEQTTIALTAMAINSLGGKAASLTGAQAGIATDETHTKARIDTINAERVWELLNQDQIVIVAGFQGITPNGLITTLGRGGSDLTAIALAAALKADQCLIFTDVDGVFTCDPRVEPKARKLSEISYDEMLEMASSGSKVMQSRSVEFAKKFGVRFEVRNSRNDNPGTLVKEEDMSMESVVIRGVSLEKNQAKVTISGVKDMPGVAARMFEAISAKNLVIDMIVQNISKTNVADISFTLNKAELDQAEAVLRPLLDELGEGATMEAYDGIAKLSVVGIGMRSHSGVAAQMFSALAKEGINILMISTSEIKTAVIIDESEIERGARIVHSAFQLDGAPVDETRRK